MTKSPTCSADAADGSVVLDAQRAPPRRALPALPGRAGPVPQAAPGAAHPAHRGARARARPARRHPRRRSRRPASARRCGRCSRAAGPRTSSGLAAATAAGAAGAIVFAAARSHRRRRRPAPAERAARDRPAAADGIRRRCYPARPEQGTPEGSSSIGRAPVSKTGGWGFESLLPCFDRPPVGPKGRVHGNEPRNQADAAAPGQRRRRRRARRASAGRRRRRARRRRRSAPPPRQFLKEVRAELRKVAWPTRPEVINYSIIVLHRRRACSPPSSPALDYLFGEFVLKLYNQ